MGKAMDKLLTLAVRGPEYAVVVEWDGCPDEIPAIKGNKAICLSYMRKHWDKVVQGKQSFGLLNRYTGRMESFIL